MTKEMMISEANNSEHWTNKRRRRKVKQDVVKFYLKKYYERQISFPCLVKLVRISPRKLDYDNLVFFFKGIRDQIADCLIPGMAKGRADGDPRISWDYEHLKGDPHQYAIRVVISEFNRKFPS